MPDYWAQVLRNSSSGRGCLSRRRCFAGTDRRALAERGSVKSYSDEFQDDLQAFVVQTYFKLPLSDAFLHIPAQSTSTWGINWGMGFDA